MAPITGRVVTVKDHTYGSELSGAHLTGATSLTVVWTNDFNADGGSLYFADPDTGVPVETITYTIPHDSEDAPSETEIDLDVPLANDYDDATPVYVYPTKVERECWFIPPDGEEPIVARVPRQLRGLLPLDARDPDTAEQIECVGQGTDLVVSDVLAQVIQSYDLDLVAGETGAVRFLRDGVVMGVVQAQLDVSGDNFLWLWMDDNDGVNSTMFRLRAPTGGSPASEYEMRAVVNGVGKNILSGDGASDYEFDESEGWQDWTPTLSGWAADPAGGIYRYKQVGKSVHVAVRQPSTATSNATTKSITLPVPAASIANMHWSGLAVATDNGTDLATASRAVVQSGSGTIDFAKDLSTNTGGWTASGAHRIRTASLVYEAA